MRAGELRHRGEVQKLDGSTWTPYAAGYFSIETTGDSDGWRMYSLMTRWTPALAYLQGVRELNKAYQIVVQLGGRQCELVIESAMDPDNRQERMALLCKELLPAI